jgi:plastocyanin
MAMGSALARAGLGGTEAMRVLFALGLVSAALVGTACSGPTSSEPPVPAHGQFTMRVDNTMKFGTPAISVEAGQPVELTLENVGGMPHDFTLSDGVAQPVKIEAAGGQTAQGSFAIDKPGTYQFVCSQPAHAMAGMRGTIVVQ